MLTIKDLAARVNIPRSTLYAWVAQGRIPCRKIYGLIRFEPAEIEEWLASLKLRPPSPVPSLKRDTPPDLEALIEGAKRAVYTPVHGETITPSPNRKEETYGAR